MELNAGMATGLNVIFSYLLMITALRPAHTGLGQGDSGPSIHGDGKIFFLQIDQNSCGGYFDVWFNLI